MAELVDDERDRPADRAEYRSSRERKSGSDADLEEKPCEEEARGETARAERDGHRPGVDDDPRTEEPRHISYIGRTGLSLSPEPLQARAGA
jgi:hypothetical protein